ncbi:MAG TPA: type II toxin-antitoxin system PemK/MazF family toxin [Pseudobacteroides sp.]|nr:type II toxin-antitoxin system PemK/MazF family toxin [Pseudobacteroides sp.]
MNDFFKLVSQLFRDMTYFNGKKYANKDNYNEEYLKWIQEVSTKNRVIHYENSVNNKNVEDIPRQRGNVYWIDFGVNTGSEFNYPHFCVVIKEFKYSAIVIPLSTEKEDDPEWKSPQNLIVQVGAIKNLPDNTKNCYALVNQIRTVSKKRLSIYEDENKKKYTNLKLDGKQLNLIEEQIIKLCRNYTFDTIPWSNDYY